MKATERQFTQMIEKKVMKFCFASCLLLLSVIHGSVRAEGPSRPYTPIPGTRALLIPPAGFEPSSQFAGYMQKSTNASILVTGIPGPFSETSAGFSMPDKMKQQGMQLLNKESVTIDDRQGLLVHIRQAAYGTTFLKWVLVFGDEKESMIVTATFPESLAQTHSKILKESVLSARWQKNSAASPEAVPLFSIEAKGSLKLAKKMGPQLLYTLNGVFPSPSINDPIFVVGPSVAPASLGDAKAFSEARIKKTAMVTQIQIDKSNAIQIDGLNGHEIVASARDEKSTEPMLICQTVLFDENYYYLMQGIVSAKRSSTFLPIFKEMARTFKKKR